MSLFLINPDGGKRRMAKKRRTAAQRRATAKMIAANRKRRRVGTRKRRRTKARRTSAPRVVVINPGGGNMARRKRSRSAPRRRRRVARARVRRNPPRKRSVRRRRRSTFRRNPPVLRIITSGFVSGLAGLGGSVAVKKLSAAIPAPKDAAGMVNPFVQSVIDLVVGAGVSFAATKFRLPTTVAASVTTGAMMAVYERVLTRHVPAIATPLLGEDRFYGLTPGSGTIPGAYGTGLYPSVAARIASNGGPPDMGLYPGTGVESEDFAF